MISIIIPAYNEEANIVRLQKEFSSIINNRTAIEVIIVDGGSTDNTVTEAKHLTTHVYDSPQKGRAAQMNYGASKAKGTIFYFVHADVSLMPGFDEYIRAAINEGVDFGCFRYDFDSKKKTLKFNAYLTQYNSVWAGGGDQTLFIKKEVFESLQGFRADYIIMEDFDVVKRAKKRGYKFKILPHSIVVSARKYNTNSWVRVHLANITIVIAWKLGASQQWMKRTYKKLLNPY
jgi:rSAM/selenodomain-associated transferase 2